MHTLGLIFAMEEELSAFKKYIEIDILDTDFKYINFFVM